VIKLKILDIFNSEDKDIKKIVVNKTTLEIVLLILKSNIEKKTLYTDKFLDLNTIKASRSKKITIIQGLEKSKILERSFDENDKRRKIIKIRDEIKNKLNRFLD
tara:strand:- start:239 stop:550 length:312 start_codon:yes stop_codon:yes gene_type:complete